MRGRAGWEGGKGGQEGPRTSLFHCYPQQNILDSWSQVKPSVLHGDLWSGNISGVDGQPSIFDPAVYYGHSEADFGMSWCAGFNSAFYQAYHEVLPKAPGEYLLVLICQMQRHVMHPQSSPQQAGSCNSVAQNLSFKISCGSPGALRALIYVLQLLAAVVTSCFSCNCRQAERQR